MKNINKYIEHIEDQESKITVKKLIDKINYVKKNYNYVVTDFMNPYEVSICLPILKNNTIKHLIYPEYKECERKVFIIYPDFFNEINVDDYICGIRIKNKSKYKSLTHKDYLGSIMSQGIERAKIGDIYVHEEYADIVVQKEITDYLIYNINKIGRNKIEIEEIKTSEINYKENDYNILNISISSLRLDNIVRALINKSRDFSVNKIKSGDIKVNWKEITKISYNVSTADVISIRYYGRYKIDEIMGFTKSGRQKIRIKYYIDKINKEN